MPLTFVAYPAIPLVCVYGMGALFLEDLRGALNELTHAGVASHPRLVDLREATLHISAAHMRRYVALKANHLKVHNPVRVAAIANDLITYGMLRMYELLSAQQEPEIGVFRTLPEAVDWLSIQPEVSREVGA